MHGLLRASPWRQACRAFRRARAATVSMMLAFLPAIAGAATFYSQGNLAADSLASWNSARDGSGVAPGDFSSGDTFVIQAGHQLSTSAPWSVSGGGSTVWVESNGSLDATQPITLDPAGTFRVDSAGTYVHDNTAPFAATIFQAGTVALASRSTVVLRSADAAGPAAVAFGNLTVDFQANPGAVLTLGAGVTSIRGDLNLSAGSLALASAAAELEVSGNWTRAGGVFAPQGGLVRLAGDADQSVISAGGEFARLALVKPAGRVLIADDLSVTDSLDLAGGNLDTGANRVSIGISGAVARTSGQVVGRLDKHVAAGASTQTWEIGDESRYSPVTISGVSAGFGSAFTLEASTVAGDRGDVAASGIDPARSVNRTFTLASADYLGGSFDLTLAFDPADLDAGAEPGGFVVRRSSGAVWSAAAVADRQATSIRATGLTGFGDFSTGEQAIDRYAVAAGSPEDRGATFSTSVTALDAIGQPVVSDTTTQVSMSSDGSVEYDADGNASFGDSVKVLAHGTFTIATRDTVAQTVTLAATDGRGHTGSRTGLVIAAPLVIVTTSLPDAVAGRAYSQGAAASGGVPPYAWSLESGALPAGLTLSPGGVISGTATAATSSALTLAVADAASHGTTRAFTLTVVADTASIVTFAVQPSNALAGATLAPPVRVRVTDASANPIPGISVSLSLSGSGALSGGAAVATDSSGLATFASLSVDQPGTKALIVHAAALAPVASDSFQIGCPAISILPATLPDGSLTVAYSQSLSANTGHPPVSFAVTSGALPAGLSLTAGGLLSGTPTVADSFSFAVTATDSIGCAGSRTYALIVHPLPAAVMNLAALQTQTGNDNDGTVKIQITFTPPPGAASAEVYRAGFGHYPLYDDAGGSVPAIPAYPPTTPWSLTGVTASGQFDEPPTRDFYYYVVFVKNAAGGRSAASNRSNGALNYHLGDVSNGLVAGTGNNLVGDEDISLLGAHYGITGSAIGAAGVAYLDVGPTTDFQPTSRPFTDGRIDFEDLIVFATNYRVVSGSSLAARAAPVAADAPAGASSAASETFTVAAPSQVEGGEEFDAALRLDAGGRMQGFSVRLHWNASVVEPVGMESRGFVESQGGIVLAPEPGTVDGALLGSRAVGLQGAAPVAVVHFRALRSGDPEIGVAAVVARDRRNEPVKVDTRAGPRPSRTELSAVRPNPGHGRAVFDFSLAIAGNVELEVFGVDGRRVRMIARGSREAGVYRETWDGRDDSGRSAAPGVYYVHLLAGGRRFVRSLVLLR